MTEERKEALANLDEALANDVINSFKALKVTNDEAYDLFSDMITILHKYTMMCLQEPPDEVFVFKKVPF